VLSNEYGRAPLVIDGITVGDDEGKNVLAALVGGHGRWEIPVGQTATSDPVPLPVAAGEELSVSCFIAGRAPAATFLHSAQRTGEHAPGNQLGQRRLTGASQFRSLYWIARVLVDTPAAGPVIIAFGDSITRGDRTTPDRDQRYPDHLQRSLPAAGAADAVVLNAGLGANRLLQTGLGPSMAARLERDVLGVAEATHVIIMGGVNDIGLPAVLGGEPPGAAKILDGMLTLAARARQHGIQPVLGTITPFGAKGGGEQIRQDVNRAITTQQDWPVADFAAAVAAPGDHSRLDPALDSGDGLHPGDAGAQALAGAVDPATFT
jgi:lysophospholipase L1-like esterase